MDNGRHCPRNWEKKQLHFLWCFSKAGVVKEFNFFSSSNADCIFTYSSVLVSFFAILNVFRFDGHYQALDRGAVIVKANKIATGHNADDIAETVLMNILRGDIARLQRCTGLPPVSSCDLQLLFLSFSHSLSLCLTFFVSLSLCLSVSLSLCLSVSVSLSLSRSVSLSLYVSHTYSHSLSFSLSLSLSLHLRIILTLIPLTAIVTGSDDALPRCKPFKYTYEKEIVMYAYFKKLEYFSTECIYAPNAYRSVTFGSHSSRQILDLLSGLRLTR